jgi:hypothetical protein
LFIHGDGGNGKTLALRYLRARPCKHWSSGKEIGMVLAHGDTDPLTSGAINAIGTLRDTFRQRLAKEPHREQHVARDDSRSLVGPHREPWKAPHDRSSGGV